MLQHILTFDCNTYITGQCWTVRQCDTCKQTRQYVNIIITIMSNKVSVCVSVCVFEDTNTVMLTLPCLLMRNLCSTLNGLPG